MTKILIYTTGNGRHKQYARREDGVLFYRLNIGWNGAPIWGQWHISIDQRPMGLYLSKRAGYAKLPEPIKSTDNVD